MGLRIVFSKWLDEILNEAEASRRSCEKMQKEHDKMLGQYRELRDAKDEEIAKLHSEIEVLKQDKEKLRKEVGRLKQAVSFYEKRHKMEVLDEKEVQS